jgi:hypothetical protein
LDWNTGHEIDLVALDHAVGRLLGRVGALLVVGHDDLGRQAAELAAVLLHGELEGIADVHAQPGARPRERAEQADLHLVGGLRGGGQAQGGGGHNGQAQGGGGLAHAGCS